MGKARGRWPDAVAIAALVLAVSLPTLRTLASGPALCVGGRTDLFAAQLPAIEDHRTQHFPAIWRTTPFGGFLTAGEPQERSFYPPLLIYSLLELPLAEHVYLLGHALLFALGAYGLLRARRCLPLAALGGALALGLCQKRFGYEVAGWDPIFSSVAWVPLAIWLFLASLERGSRAAALGFGVVATASVLAGQPMILAYLALTLPLPALAASRRPWRVARTSLLAFATFAALSAPFLFTALELSWRGPRSDMRERYGTELPLDLVALVKALALPDATRENVTSWEMSSGFGHAFLPLVGAGIAVARGRRRMFPCALAALSLLFAMGLATPVGRVVAALPVISKFTYVTRNVWAADVALALLAGIGLDALLRAGPSDAGRARRRARRLAIGLGAGAALGLVARLAFHPSQRMGDGVFGPALHPVCLGVSIALTLALPALPARSRRVRFPAVIVLVLATLLEQLALAETIIERVPWERFVAPSPIVRVLAAESHPRLAVVTEASWGDPVVPLFPPCCDRLGGYTPLYPRDTARLVYAIEGDAEQSPQLPIFRAYLEVQKVERWDLLALAATHVATRFRVEGLALIASETRPVLAQVGTWVVRGANLYALPSPPRAYLMRRARAVPATEQLARLTGTRDFDARRTLLTEGPVPPELEGDVDAPLPAEIVRYEPDRVVLRAEAPATGGWLVLADAWAPEWSARVDGEPARIERADHLFRSVRVGPGPHTVEMNVHFPRGFKLGLVLGALGLGLVASFLVLERRLATVSARGSRA
jgi:hypothetical protein